MPHSLPCSLLLGSLVFILPLAQGQDQPVAPAATKPERPLAPGGKYLAHDISRPRPVVVTPPKPGTGGEPGQAPSDAVILFDGKDLAAWKRDKPAEDGSDAPTWKVENGYFEIVPKGGSIRTREKIKGDAQWHIEWATPAEVKGSGQGRGNSGVFIGGFPEVQVLDSFGNDTYPDGQAAGLYGHYPPLVNASRQPGDWQTYDIVIERPQKDEKGAIVRKARISVIHNGLVVQWAREFTAGAEEGDLGLQDHGNPVRYRNIWVRPLNLTDPDSQGTPPPAKK